MTAETRTLTSKSKLYSRSCNHRTRAKSVALKDIQGRLVQCLQMKTAQRQQAHASQEWESRDAEPEQAAASKPANCLRGKAVNNLTAAHTQQPRLNLRACGHAPSHKQRPVCCKSRARLCGSAQDNLRSWDIKLEIQGRLKGGSVQPMSGLALPQSMYS